MTKIRSHPGKEGKGVHLFLFLGEGPDGKKRVSLRASGFFSTSKAVLNRNQALVHVCRKESLHLGESEAVCPGHHCSALL